MKLKIIFLQFLLIFLSINTYANLCAQPDILEFIGKYYSNLNEDNSCPKAIELSCLNDKVFFKWKNFLTSYDEAIIWSTYGLPISEGRYIDFDNRSLIFSLHENLKFYGFELPLALHRSTQVLKVSPTGNFGVSVSANDTRIFNEFVNTCSYNKISIDEELAIKRKEFLNLPQWEYERSQYSTWEELYNVDNKIPVQREYINLNE